MTTLGPVRGSKLQSIACKLESGHSLALTNGDHCPKGLQWGRWRVQLFSEWWQTCRLEVFADQRTPRPSVTVQTHYPPRRHDLITKLLLDLLGLFRRNNSSNSKPCRIPPMWQHFTSLHCLSIWVRFLSQSSKVGGWNLSLVTWSWTQVRSW